MDHKFWRRILCGMLLLLSGWLGGAWGQVHQGVELVRASLVANRSAVVPGETMQLGVLMDLAPGWHVYWRNPGDAGLATTLQWTLPPGFTVSSIEWPLPQRIVEPGDLVVFGYKERVLLPVTLTVPQDLKISEVTEATFSVKADWLVCEAICIPGRAEMSLTLPVLAESAPQNMDLFDSVIARGASPEPAPFAVEWQVVGEAPPVPEPGLRLQLTGLPDWVQVVDFFPREGVVPEPGHASPAKVEAGAATVFIPTTVPLGGLVVLRGEGHAPAGWMLDSPTFAPLVAGAAPAAALAPEPSVPPAPSVPLAPTDASWSALAVALLYGLLGGFILNLMPCVLPVISLKVFGFMRQAGESPERIFRHGLAFVAGIFLWFLGLAFLIIALRAGGGEVTWAFQFQNSWFILFICAVVFVFALNLFGVFEIALPGSAGTHLSAAAEREGYSGSFFQGVFATLLATPCTAPFLGTALGFAFAQPAPVILAMFASVALGMGFPYLLLAARPAWIRFLPKPGTWMERLKQFMGFPLLATLLWLLFVLGGQKGVSGIIWAGAILLCLGLACWIYGAFCGVTSAARGRAVALLLVVIFAGGGSWFFGRLFAAAERSGGEAAVVRGSAEGIAWVPFSAATLAGLLEEGRPVFVDFTADWCITCKVNEKLAINTPAVRALLNEAGIVPMKADWTNADPAITAALAEFGRVGVPFYVFYPQGREVAPVIFPELLTEGVVLERLRAGLAERKNPQ